MTPTARPRPRKKPVADYHHGALRKALTDATMAIALRDGLEGVTMRAVARRAGVSQAASYHHFRDKRELLGHAAADGFRRLDDYFRPAIAAAARRGAVAQVEAMAEAYVRFAVEATGAFRLVFGAHVVELELAAIPETLAAGRAARERLEGVVQAFLDESGATMPLATLTRLIWSHVHGTAWLMVERELGRDFTVEDGVALARDGVRRLLASVRA